MRAGERAKCSPRATARCSSFAALTAGKRSGVAFVCARKGEAGRECSELLIRGPQRDRSAHPSRQPTAWTQRLPEPLTPSLIALASLFTGSYVASSCFDSQLQAGTTLVCRRRSACTAYSSAWPELLHTRSSLHSATEGNSSWRSRVLSRQRDAAATWVGGPVRWLRRMARRSGPAGSMECRRPPRSEAQLSITVERTS